MTTPLPIHGRGAAENPANRFETMAYEPDPDAYDPDEKPNPRTVFLRESSRTIIATNDSPDVGFNASINPYRGCEHGCIYCYARPTHEYLGFSPGLDFETKILVKEDAPVLLRKELASPKWKPQVLGLSGVTDPYQPIERKLQLTRRCLEVLAEFRNPVAIITKNHLVTRDADLLAELAKHKAALVFVSITTLDRDLKLKLEPRTSQPQARFDAIRELTACGIQCGVMVAPVIPGLTDHEVPAILEEAAAAGAKYAGSIPVRLPFAVKDLFEQWLRQHFPDRAEKVLGRIRDMRGGRLNDPNLGSRMKGSGEMAATLRLMFHLACKKVGINREKPEVSTASFRRPGGEQSMLFE